MHGITGTAKSAEGAILATMLLAAILHAQETAGSPVERKMDRLADAGQYVSKHYVVAPFAIRADASVHRLSDRQLTGLCDAIDSMFQAFGGGRRVFVSEDAWQSLEASLSRDRDFSDETVRQRLDEFVTPVFASSLDALAATEAQELLDEQQRNSFISDKAKQSPVTNDEIGVVKTSGYIIVPWVNNYSASRSDKGYWFCKIGVGILVFAVTKSATDWKTTLRTAPYDKSLLVPGNPNLNLEFVGAYHNAAINAMINLKDLVGFQDFSVTSQVLEHDFSRVVFSVPSTEEKWVRTDTRVRFQQLEGDGSTTGKKNQGWALVIGKTGDLSAGDPEFSAQVISGFPTTGTLVKEIKTGGGNISFGWSVIPLRFKTKHDSLWKDSGGPAISINSMSSKRTFLQMPELTFAYPLAKNIPALRQTFINWSLSLAWYDPQIDTVSMTVRENAGDAPDTCVSDGNVLWLGLGVGLSKRMYFRRLVLEPFADARFGMCDYAFTAKRSQDTFSIIFGFPMITTGSDFGIAISPDFNIGVSLWYRWGFPFVWSIIKNSGDDNYMNSQTGTFVPGLNGLGYTIHLSILF